MSKAALRTEVTREGQPFVDEPVYVEVSDAKPLARSIAAMFKRAVPRIETLDHYERVRLRWMTRNSSGALVPQKGQT